MSASTFDIVDFFSKAGVGVLTGAVAAVVTAKVALNRFYLEKWWEKKHTSYNQLIDILFEIKAIYDHASDYYEQVAESGRRLSPMPKGKVDWVQFYELKAKVHRFYVVAPISLSPSTRVLLDQFFKTDAATSHSVHEEGYPDFVAYHDMANSTKKLIDAIVIDAQAELKFK